MLEERRQNLSEADRASDYNQEQWLEEFSDDKGYQEQWLEEFSDDKGAFYNGSESDDSDNDAKNYNENNEQE